MSYTLRTRRVAYDNIAVGSATGRENPAVGLAGSTEQNMNGEHFGIASSMSTDKAVNRIITTTGGVTTLEPLETIINTN